MLSIDEIRSIVKNHLESALSKSVHDLEILTHLHQGEDLIFVIVKYTIGNQTDKAVCSISVSQRKVIDFISGATFR